MSNANCAFSPRTVLHKNFSRLSLLALGISKHTHFTYRNDKDAAICIFALILSTGLHLVMKNNLVLTLLYVVGYFIEFFFQNLLDFFFRLLEFLHEVSFCLEFPKA